MTFFYPHQGWPHHAEKPPRIIMVESLPSWNAVGTKKTPRAHSRIKLKNWPGYIYIIIVLYILLYYIYIRMYIAYMYMIYIVATLSQKRHLSVSSQKIPSGDAPVFDWGLGRSDHRDVDHLVIRISKRGKTVNRYVKSGGYVYYIYICPTWYVIYNICQYINIWYNIIYWVPPNA